jgi:hypothetical protein
MRGILVLLAACVYGSAQRADPPLTFEVASVKMAGAAESAAKAAKKNAVGSVRVSANPIRFSRRNATLASLLLTAGSLQPQQLLGPERLTSERYEIEEGPATESSPAVSAASGAPVAEDPGMNLFVALESQLGLKLEPKKGMVGALVVDHAEKVPTDN